MTRADRPDAARIHFDVAVDHDSEPISGMLDDGVTTIEFTGWLELMSAFDTARARATSAENASGDATSNQ